MGRYKTTFQLKAKEKCPGERVCTTDVVYGVIARLRNETLQTYCNPDRCKLYHTKPNTTPKEFEAAIDWAYYLSELKAANRLSPDADLSYFAEQAFLCSERARNVVEKEIADEREQAQANQTSTPNVPGLKSQVASKFDNSNIEQITKNNPLFADW